MTSVAAALGDDFGIAALVGCATNHDLSRQKPRPRFRRRPQRRGGRGDSFPVVGRDSSTKFDAGDPEPPGPWSLTLINGVVDVGRVRFCFVPVVSGNEVPPTKGPPVPAAGLSYGRTSLSPRSAGSISGHRRPPVPRRRLAEGLAPFSCREVPRSATANAEAGADSGGDAVALATGTRATRICFCVRLAPPHPGRPRWENPAASSRSLTDARARLLRPSGRPAMAATSTQVTRRLASIAKAPLDTGACGRDSDRPTLGLTLVRLSRRTNFSKIGFQTCERQQRRFSASFLVEQANTKSQRLLHRTPSFSDRIRPRAADLRHMGDLGVVPPAAILRVTAPTGAPPFPEFHTDLATVLAATTHRKPISRGNQFHVRLLGARPGRGARFRRANRSRSTSSRTRRRGPTRIECPGLVVQTHVGELGSSPGSCTANPRSGAKSFVAVLASFHAWMSIGIAPKEKSRRPITSLSDDARRADQDRDGVRAGARDDAYASPRFVAGCDCVATPCDALSL